MRIGLEVTYAYMGRGGIDRYARELARALLSRPREEEYVLLTLFAPFRRRDLTGAPIEQPAARKLAMAQVELMRRLWSRLGRPAADTMTGPVDVLHTTHHFAPPVRSARLVVTVHDLSFEHPEFEIAGAELFSRDTRRAVERADAVVVPSAFVRDELVERYRFPSERRSVRWSTVFNAPASSERHNQPLCRRPPNLLRCCVRCERGARAPWGRSGRTAAEAIASPGDRAAPGDG